MGEVVKFVKRRAYGWPDVERFRSDPKIRNVGEEGFDALWERCFDAAASLRQSPTTEGHLPFGAQPEDADEAPGPQLRCLVVVKLDRRHLPPLDQTMDAMRLGYVCEMIGDRLKAAGLSARTRDAPGP